MGINSFLRTLSIYVPVAVILFCPLATRSQEALTGASDSGAIKPSESPALSDIKPKRLERRGAREQFEVKALPPLPEGKGKAEDEAQQKQATSPSRFTVVRKFAGLKASDNRANLAPPDSAGAPGKEQYVQWINQTMMVFGKDGSVKYSATDGDTIWTGSGGPCEESNDGDPIVLFDHLKGTNNQDGRWILSQFAVAQGPPYYQCVAVSKTSNALGPYYRYAFKFELFNDYAKIGIWPNAYDISFNMFQDQNKKDASGNEIFKYIGPRACALEREKMLQGLPAHMQCFNPQSRSLLPADVDGSLNPASDAPGLFMDYAVGAVRIWQMKVNWNDAHRSTLSAPKEIAVEPFSEACHNAGCVSQPGTEQKLDASGDRLMFRLAYRRFEGADPYEVLLANHTVRVNAEDKDAADSQVAAIRWYELRRTRTTPWTIKQQGTYSPDILNKTPSSRWGGSIAMDRCGNILLGYSKSGRDAYPSIYLTGWTQKHDTLQQLEVEREAQPGRGSVPPNSKSKNSDMYRWGDYSSMTLDPDDSTFWYTSEDQAANQPYAWETYIFSVRFPQDCKDAGGPANAAKQ